MITTQLNQSRQDLLKQRIFSSDRAVSAETMKAFAENLAQTPLLLGKYLNMLSLLEFIGTRALINTFATQKEANDTNLKHVLEEARHSLSLRKMGEKLAKRNLEYNDDSVFSNLNANYFIKRMIAYVHNDLKLDSELLANQDKRHRLVILYVSGILEVRAVWWYSIFNDAIAKKAYNINFKQVLADEEGHISSIEQEIKEVDFEHHRDRLDRYFPKEEGLFARYYEGQKNYLLTYM